MISRKDIKDLYPHHVLRSLDITDILRSKPGSSVMGLGTGDGFPNIPLTISFSETRFHLIDNIRKKIKMGQAVVEAIGLEGVSFRHRRGEEEEQLFDFAVDRAVMSLAGLVKIIRKNIKREQTSALPDKLIRLKGGKLAYEILPFRNQAVGMGLKDHFKEKFFETKRVVYISL